MPGVRDANAARAKVAERYLQKCNKIWIVAPIQRAVDDKTAKARARRKATVAALFFVLGLSTVFLLLGSTASAFGAFVLQNQELFTKVSGAVVIIFGLHFLGVFRIPILDREARMETGDAGGSSFGAYILGLAFAFGWTPCIGPQLGAILSLAASEASVAST